jgi:hypothetical protein
MSVFKEVQKITQWWVWAILSAIAGIWGWGLIYQLVLGHHFGNKPLSNTGLLVSAIIPFGMIIFFCLLELKTEITPNGLDVTYFPLWHIHLKWEEIQRAEIINYAFVGYGIRFSTDYGTVYNAKGDIGLLLQKKDGKKILIGTQLPEQLASILTEVYPNSAP